VVNERWKSKAHRRSGATTQQSAVDDVALEGVGVGSGQAEYSKGSAGAHHRSPGHSNRRARNNLPNRCSRLVAAVALRRRAH
jgi:hypothetical protein